MIKRPDTKAKKGKASQKGKGENKLVRPPDQD